MKFLTNHDIAHCCDCDWIYDCFYKNDDEKKIKKHVEELDHYVTRERYQSKHYGTKS